MAKKIPGLLVLCLIAILTSTFTVIAANGLKSWVGEYTYEEKPAKALAGYNMIMTWDLSIGSDAKAVIEVNGQQTYFSIQAKVTGDANLVKLTFDKGLDGTGYEYLKKGDVLFQLKNSNGKLTTWWNQLTPRLTEQFKNGTVCFIKN